MNKVYNDLMKNGRYTNAQKKSSELEYINSISEFVKMCEEDGFIPVYYTDGPQDKVDKTILDMENYTKDLVANETNLNQLLEIAIDKINRDKIAEEEMPDSDEDESGNTSDAYDDALFKQHIITDKDFSDFEDFEEGLEEQNKTFFDSLKEGN